MYSHLRFVIAAALIGAAVATAILIGDRGSLDPDVERRLQERRGAIGRKRAQHVSHDARGSPPEVALAHDPIGDVASRSTTDQDLRADLRGAES